MHRYNAKIEYPAMIATLCTSILLVYNVCAGEDEETDAIDTQIKKNDPSQELPHEEA